MNITVSIEINKDSFENFEDIESICYQFGLEAGREMMVKIFKMLDDEILATRDVSRYRCKGFNHTCVKTLLGAVEYDRRVYVDNAAVESLKCVHLLDQELNVESVGMVSQGVCELISKNICESSFRSTSRQITELTGLSISAQGVWNVVQKAGQSQKRLADRYSELASANQGLGQISTKILYEENDGIYIKLQGQSRKDYGASKEMKVGIAYDGAQWKINAKGDKRRVLDNKIAYAGFESVDSFRSHKEGIIASRFNTDEIEMRVVNGDGAGWVQNYGNGENTIVVLDEYHRNKKIKECVRDKDFQKLLTDLLNSKRYDDLIECIKAQINSIDDLNDIDQLKDLLSYYENNRDAMPGYYDRGIEIPATRDPEIHHARLGSMESNVFTLIGNRMKGKRRCWSISGANNMASLLCAYHTTGLEHLFAAMPSAPVPVYEETLTDEELAFINAPVRMTGYTDGKGYEHPWNASTTNASPLLKRISDFSPLSEMKFFM